MIANDPPSTLNNDEMVSVVSSAPVSVSLPLLELEPSVEHQNSFPPLVEPYTGKYALKLCKEKHGGPYVPPLGVMIAELKRRRYQSKKPAKQKAGVKSKISVALDDSDDDDDDNDEDDEMALPIKKSKTSKSTDRPPLQGQSTNMGTRKY